VTVLTKDPTAHRTSVGPVVRELARFEAKRMLRHPLTVVGVAGSLWAMWTLFGGRAPVLERDSILLAAAMLPLAAATFLVAFHAALRQRATPELLSAQPADRDARLLGVQLGALGPTLAGMVLTTLGIVYFLMGDPIGGLLLWEILSGIAMIPIGGVLGTALARWLPHAIVAPVALVGLAIVQFWASPGFEVFDGFPWSEYVNADVEWLAPWMVLDSFAPLEVIGERPALLHLVYLILLAFVVAYLTQEASRVRLVSRVAVAVGFVVALGAVSLGLADDADAFEWLPAAEAQVCQVTNGIEYCAFRYYEDWIPRWQATVASVDELAEVNLDQVMQRPHNIGWDDNSGLRDRKGLALTALEWDRPAATPEQRFSLALMAAESSVGLPSVPQIRRLTEEEIASIVEQNPDYPGDLAEQLRSDPPSEQSCSGIGQARTAAAVWIAGVATPDGVAVIDGLLESNPDSALFSLAYIDPYHRHGVNIGRSDAVLARELLGLGQLEVHSVLLDHWDQLVDPATTSAEMSSWFELATPDDIKPDFYEVHCS
jgi:hypothetical protein